MAQQPGSASQIFVSYAHEDTALITTEIERLRELGYDIWYDESLQAGQNWRDQLANRISDCSMLIFFVSRNSIESATCIDEVEFAKNHDRIILPIYLDDTELPPGLELSIGSVHAIKIAFPYKRDSKLLETSIANALSGTPFPRTPQRSRNPSRFLAAIMVIATLALVWFEFRTGTQPFPPNSVAVLRFENLGANVHFSDGLADRLTDLLSRIKELIVPSRISSWSLNLATMSAPEIAERLQVVYLLEGSVQQIDSRVRVIAQLIDARIDEHVWAETYDLDYSTESFFTVQDEIARAIASEIEITLSEQSNLILLARSTRNDSALVAYLEGHDYLRKPKSTENVAGATRSFEIAINEDPGYAEAYAGLCEAHLAAYTVDRNPTHFDNGKTACLEALRIDSMLGPVYAALGSLHRYEGNYDEALVNLETAAIMLPNDATVLEETGRTHRATGQLIQAEEAFDKAIEKEPTSWSVYKSKGVFLARTGRFEESIPYFRQVLTMTPDNVDAYNNLAGGYYMTGDFTGAVNTWRFVVDQSSDTRVLMNYANAQYYQKDYHGASETYRRALAANDADFRVWTNLAHTLIHIPNQAGAARETYLGAIERAKDYLTRQPNNPEALSQLAMAYAWSDQSELAEATLSQLRGIGWTNPNASHFVALTELKLDRPDAAIQELERAIVLGWPGILINADPDFAVLRGNDKFADLQQAIQQAQNN